MRARLFALGLALLLGLAAPAPVVAQDRATLVADRVLVSPDGRLIAEGTVEVLYQGRRLRAARIVYDQAADSLTIAGPIVLTDDAGTLILADQAELSADLTEGLLTSARLVLNQQLQLAAAELRRVSGRYTQLSRAVASSCRVCAESPVPLWEIRAARVTHDQEARQIYFDNAQLRVMGLPVVWLPRLRIPDPTRDRATGFLMPRLRTTSELGTGLRLPYFIPLGPHRDLTLEPYLGTERMRTLGFRYRQAFRRGEITFDGALSRDQILPGDTRGYLFGRGRFDLPAGFTLAFGVEAVSDDAYLQDYGLSNDDRLDSRLTLTRSRDDEDIALRLIRFHSIRAGEDNAILPSTVIDATWRRRFRLAGGSTTAMLQGHAHRRSSTSVLDSNLDGIPDGRDMARLTARADWRRSWTLPVGIQMTGLGAATAEVYELGQDPDFASTISRGRASAGVELRWPWLRRGGGGATQIIEPVVQLVLSPSDARAVPNEDSRLVEFDEGNLFSLNRFPGADETEAGSRLNLGVSFGHHTPAGWGVQTTLGRVVRAQNLGQFSAASGLDGLRSDWLAAVGLSLGDRLSVAGRTLFDDDLDSTKAEVRIDWRSAETALAAGYSWVIADPAEDRPQAISELVFEGGWQINDRWRGRAGARYDFTADRAATAGLGFAWRNECLEVDLSLSRRFTSSTSLTPTTEFGLAVDLLGFGGRSAAGPSRRCGP